MFIVGRIWEVIRVQGVINREAKVRQKNQNEKWPLKRRMIPLKKHIFKKIKHTKETFYWFNKQSFCKLFLPGFKETVS